MTPSLQVRRPLWTSTVAPAQPRAAARAAGGALADDDADEGPADLVRPDALADETCAEDDDLEMLVNLFEPGALPDAHT